MQWYEYLVIKNWCIDGQILNKYGEDRWELVTMHHETKPIKWSDSKVENIYTFIFKRLQEIIFLEDEENTK